MSSQIVNEIFAPSYRSMKVIKLILWYQLSFTVVYKEALWKAEIRGVGRQQMSNNQQNRSKDLLTGYMSVWLSLAWELQKQGPPYWLDNSLGYPWLENEHQTTSRRSYHSIKNDTCVIFNALFVKLCNKGWPRFTKKCLLVMYHNPGILQ